jgi:hypothetical protein
MNMERAEVFPLLRDMFSDDPDCMADEEVG